MRFLAMIGGIGVVFAVATGIWWWVSNLTIRPPEESLDIEKEMINNLEKAVEKAVQKQKENE